MQISNQRRKLSILLICDFFYPQYGGVEIHLYQLACSLIRQGHKITILTRSRKNRQGIRYMGNGMKVYYNPMITLYHDTSFPILFGTCKTVREIILKESIDIIHCHQPTSAIATESLMHARSMGARTIFTDHSIYGFGNIIEVNINKVIRSVFTDLDQAICVSNIQRDNLVIRSMIHPNITNVIPNGVDFTKFTPDVHMMEIKKNKNPKVDTITIVSIFRHFYRKGVDLLIEVVPEICKMFPNVNFIIGGDGPKKCLLESMVKFSNLSHRVLLTGSVPHNQVRNILIKGDFFLNTSLTESFCIAILEAASCGLYTIATNVGGVGEVLPDTMVRLVNPDKKSIIEGISDAIENYHKIFNFSHYNEFNYVLSYAYNWDKVANKASLVYYKAMDNKDRSFITRIKRAYGIGPVAGIFHCIIILLDYFLLMIIAFLFPKRRIKKEKEFKYEKYVDYLKKLK